MNSKFPPYIYLVPILWFVVLCVMHLVVQRPLWNDEEAVFLSIEAFSFKQMFTQNMIRVQVFPRVYLFMIQQFSQCFDFARWSLRLPSFLCMLGGFFLWIKMTQRKFQSPLGYFAFLCSWPASMMMVYYAAELKPYSMDLLAGACALWLLIHPGKKAFLYPLFGFVSYPAFLFAFVLVYNYGVQAIRDASRWKQFLLYIVILGVTAAVSYQFDMQYRNLDAVSTGYNDYFIATDSIRNFFKTFGEGVKDLFIMWFVTEPKWIRHVASFFSVFGLFYLFGVFIGKFREEKGQFSSIETTAMGLFVALFLLGIMQKYPYIVPRTVLFYGPFIFYLMIKGIEALGRVHEKIPQVLLVAYSVFLMSLSFFLPRIILSGERIFQPIF